MVEAFKPYEVLWYDLGNNVHTKTFSTEEAAMAYYEKHKDDDLKWGWWVTKRDKDWNVLEDLVF